MCCSVFSFFNRKYPFCKFFLPFLSKLSVSGETWYLEWFQYAEFNDVFTYSVQTRNTLLEEIWSSKWRLSTSAKIWYPGQFEYAEINDHVHSFSFRPEIPFLVKFFPKSQNCQFKLSFATQNNSNMQNPMANFTLSVLDWKYPLWANLFQKVKFVSLC